MPRTLHYHVYHVDSRLNRVHASYEKAEADLAQLDHALTAAGVRADANRGSIECCDGTQYCEDWILRQASAIAETRWHAYLAAGQARTHAQRLEILVRDEYLRASDELSRLRSAAQGQPFEDRP